MPLLSSALDLDDHATDTTQTHCANSLCLEEAHSEYLRAFSRAIVYTKAEQILGDVMEFGTYSGFTARILAEKMMKFGHKGQLHLFDSFCGFPATDAQADLASNRLSVLEHWKKGYLNAPQGIEAHIFERLSPLLPPNRLHLHKGFFEETLESVAGKRIVSVLHIDADLYASTKYVLDTLCRFGCLQDGLVMLFDDYYCNRANPNFGERAALHDFLKENPRYEVTFWFSYRSTAAAFFLHDTSVTDQRCLPMRYPKDYLYDIEGSSLDLIPVAPHHAEAIVRLRNSPYARRFVAQQETTTESHASFMRAYEDRPDDLYWSLCLKSGAVIGTIRLAQVDLKEKTALIGSFVLDEAYLKEPLYALEAGFALIQFAFKTLRLERLFVHLHPDDIVSLCSYQKLGFTQSGTKELDGIAYLRLDLKRGAFRPGVLSKILRALQEAS